MIDFKGKNILLVEDEVLIAMSCERELRSLGYDVTTCFSGEEAISLVLNDNRTFDIILMDIDLGREIDGTQAAMEITKYRDIPVLFLSSHTEKDIVEKTEKITSYGYVVKQSGLTVLDASIKMAFKLHKAHSELKESRERYRVLVENISSLVCETDPQGRYTYLSPAYEKVTGWRPDELMGKYVIEHLHPDELTRWKEKFFRQHSPNETIRDIWRFRIKNGQWRWMDSSVTFIEKKNGEIYCVVITNDITDKIVEKERLERIIEENKAYFREMKSRVNSTASIIRVFADFMASCFKEEDSRRIFLNIEKRIEFCLSLYERFHIYPMPEGVTLREFVANIVELVYRIYNTPQQILVYSDELNNIFLEIKWILPVGFIINELLSNAFIHAYGNSSGEIYISAKKFEDVLLISVKDNGCGGVYSERNKIGMGLSLVNKIVEEINGDFTIVSNGGSEALLQLRISKDEE